MRLQSTKLVIAFLVVALAAYFILSANIAVRLMSTNNAVNTLLGLSIIFIPLLGLLLVIREIFFGLSTQKMAKKLSDEGGLSPDDLPRDPSGRINRDAADQRFEELIRNFDDSDWRSWYRIAVAYDDARDRKAARSAMRQAEKLFRHPPSSDQ